MRRPADAIEMRNELRNIIPGFRGHGLRPRLSVASVSRCGVLCVARKLLYVPTTGTQGSRSTYRFREGPQ